MRSVTFKLLSSNRVDSVQLQSAVPLKIKDVRELIATRIGSPGSELKLLIGGEVAHEESAVPPFSLIEVDRSAPDARRLTFNARREARDRAQNVQHVVTSGGSVLNVGRRFLVRDEAAPEVVEAESEDDEVNRIRRLQKQVSEDIGDVRMERQLRPRQERGPPPATYVCNCCGKRGHHIQDCPEPQRRYHLTAPVGIQESMLVECSADDPDRFVTRDGRFVKRVVSNTSYVPIQGSTTPLDVPAALQCQLCKKLLEEAVAVSCCAARVCSKCLDAYVEESGADCFACSESFCVDEVKELVDIRGEVQNLKARQKRPRNDEVAHVSQSKTHAK